MVEVLAPLTLFMHRDILLGTFLFAAIIVGIGLYSGTQAANSHASAQGAAHSDNVTSAVSTPASAQTTPANDQTPSQASSSQATSTPASDQDQTANLHESHAPVCPGPTSFGSARCHAHVIVDQQGSPKALAAPAGYGPTQLHVYTSQVNAPTRQTIAIVDAYDDPKIYNDLTKYSNTYHIPVLPQCAGPAASSATPCFQKINQNGGTSYPASNAGWDLEISLDVEVAHAVCQNCNILLVEANSNSYNDLMAAVDQAAAQGATEISNSYGSSEFGGETSFDSHFNHPGIAITVSSGDSGYGAQYPSSSPYVTSVGGTTLRLSGTNYGSESAWSGGGSGCSVYESKPGWQQDQGCTNRASVDVAADADPNTGAAVYDSVRYQGRSGWFKVGGTSLSAPLVAGIYALAGGEPAGTQGASLPYTLGSAANLHDVVSGSNGNCTGYLCTAGVGYDGPTGLGSPNGLGAF